MITLVIVLSINTPLATATESTTENILKNEFWEIEFDATFLAYEANAISTLEVYDRIENMALALVDSVAFRQKISHSYQLAMPGSEKKYFIQKILERSTAGMDIMREQIEAIAKGRDVKNYQHMLEMAKYVGYEFTPTFLAAVDEVLREAKFDTQYNLTLLEQAIEVFDSRNVSTPELRQHMTQTMTHLFNTHKLQSVRNISSSKLLLLADEKTRSKFANIALSDDSDDVKFNALYAIRWQELKTDDELEYRVRELSFDENTPQRIRLFALKTMEEKFTLNDEELLKIAQTITQISES